MTSAVQRTIPLFAGIEPTQPRKPTIGTLRRRLNKAALGFYRNTHGYEEVLNAARVLDEALKAAP